MRLKLIAVPLIATAEVPPLDGRRDKIAQGNLLTPAHHQDINRKHQLAVRLRQDGFAVPQPEQGDPAAKPSLQDSRSQAAGPKPPADSFEPLPLGGPASGDLRPRPKSQDVNGPNRPADIPITFVPLPSGPEGNLNNRTGDIVGTEPCDEDHTIQIEVPGPQGSEAQRTDPSVYPTEMSPRDFPPPPIAPSAYQKPQPDGNGMFGPPGAAPSCPTPEQLKRMIDEEVDRRIAEMEANRGVMTTTTTTTPEETSTTEEEESTTSESQDAAAAVIIIPVEETTTTESTTTTTEPVHEEETTTASTTQQPIETTTEETESFTEFYVVRKPGAEPVPQTVVPLLANQEEVIAEPSTDRRKLQAVFRKVIAPPLAPSFARLQNLVDNVAKTPLNDDTKEQNATDAEMLPCLLRPGGCEMENTTPTETKPQSEGQSNVLKKTQSQIAKAVTKLQKDLDMRTAEVVKEIERRAAEMRREIAQEAEQVIEAVKYLVTILADSVTRADEMGAGFVREWYDDAEHRYVGANKSSGNSTLLDEDIKSWDADFKKQNKDAHKTMVEKLKNRVEKTREKYGKPKKVDSPEIELGLVDDDELFTTEAVEEPIATTTVRTTTRPTTATTEVATKKLLDSIDAPAPGGAPAAMHYGFIDAV